jgi:2-hydroxy-6-oxonona-2,4-dienedioate hydrolase
MLCFLQMDNENLDKYIVKTNQVKTKPVNGYNIVYSESANTNMKHVLFIHGLGASFLSWRDIPDGLSEHFHTIAVDLIGFGLSQKPETADYTIKGFSKFIVDFLHQAIELKEGEKISIVGHSLGGYIAAQIAIENKDLIGKLVLIDSSGKLDGPTELLKEYLCAARELNLISRYEKIQRVFENIYARHSSLLPIVIDAFNCTIEMPHARKAFESAFHNSTGTKIQSQILKQIENIPCLIIWGKNDNLIPLNYAKEFKNDLPNAELEIIPASGHAPFVEKTALVYEKIRTFLMNQDKT